VPDLRRVYLGDDADGVPLEVMAVMGNRTTKPGTEVTPEVADALADEAERGYDLTQARRRRVGRPSLGGRGASPRLSFRATPSSTERHSAGRGRKGEPLATSPAKPLPDTSSRRSAPGSRALQARPQVRARASTAIESNLLR